MIYTSYKVYVKYIHLSSANRKPGIPGQQVQRGIMVPVARMSLALINKSMVNESMESNTVITKAFLSPKYLVIADAFLE